MTVKDIAEKEHCSEKLLRTIARHAGIDTEYLTDNDAQMLRIGISIARDKDIQRQIICRYSKKQKADIIRTAGLSDRMEVWMYTRMENILLSGKRIRMNTILQEVSKFFNCEINPALRSKAEKVRRFLWNRRKYNKRKMGKVLRE
jgi:hypothetical protein